MNSTGRFSCLSAIFLDLGAAMFTRKREKRLRHSAIAAQSGRITWTVRGIHECLRHFEIEESRLSDSNRRDWEPYIEMILYLMNTYGRAKATAHAQRMIHLVVFLDEHEEKLKKAGIVHAWDDRCGMDDDLLFQALALLPYDRREGFDFNHVMDYVSHGRSPN